jgi:ferredoxin
MKVTLDTNLCQSQGRCYNSFPDIFERSASGKGALIATVDVDDEDIRFDLQAAANLCPRGAILIEDD